MPTTNTREPMAASVDDLDDATEAESGPGVDLDVLDPSVLDIMDAPSLEEVSAEAGLPTQVSTRELANRELLWLAWRPQQAVLQETGEITDGFFALVRDPLNSRLYTAFVGGIALRRTLGRLSKPFRARIEKHGRTWVFR